MRFIWLSIAALLAFAGAIHAQVAAPRLDPTAIEVGVVNPATLPWDGPSRIGGALAVVESEDPAFAASPAAEGDAQALKLRWVGETFAFGVDAAQLDFDFDPSVPGVGGLTEELDVSVISVAFQVGEQFSIGVGQQTAEFRAVEFIPIIPAVGNFTAKSTLPLVGATLRLADVIYFGLATGKESVEIEVDIPALPFSFRGEAERTVNRFGVAYHWRDGESGVHLEYYREEVDAITIPFTEEEEESDGFTAEVVFANILIGYETITTDFTDPSGVFQGKEEETALSVGWAPGQGLAVVASVSEEEDFDDTGTLTGETTITAVALAWLF